MKDKIQQAVFLKHQGLPLFLLLMSCFFLLTTGCQKEAPPPAPPPATVLAAKSVQKDMPVEINAIGAVEAYKSIVIYPRVGGQLLQVHFQQGQDVRRGQVLFSIDPASYREKLRQAEGKLARDQAQMTFKEQEAKRYAFLQDKGAVSKSEADQYRTEAAASAALVRADQAEVEEAMLNLDYCSVRAPFDGRTGAYSVNQGAVVKANDTALVTLNQIVPVYVKFTVPEKSLREVKRYQTEGAIRVKVTPATDLQSDVRTGTLVFIDNTVDAATGTIHLKASFPNGDRFLWPGEFVKVKLQLTMRKNAVVVPLRAVQTGEKGLFVFVVKPDTVVEMRPVVMGWAVDAEAVISDGLKGGETVVTDGHLKVRPGGKVEIKENLEAAVPPKGDRPPATTGSAKP